jgi:hypothetical protein
MIVWLMSVEQLVEWEWVGETEILRENRLKWHYVHHKFHVFWSEIEAGLSQWEAMTNHLNYMVTAFLFSYNTRFFYEQF